MNFQKYVKPTIAIALAAVCAVGGTLAYLQDTTDEVKNSFTFSDDDSIDIDLTEETFGEKGNTDAVAMVPSVEIAKDPKVTVKGDDCYIYVDVTESCAVDGYALTDFIDYAISSNWEEVENVDENPSGTKTYVYTAGTGTPVKVTSSDGDFYILDDNKVTVKSTVTAEMLALAKEENPSLSFVGYALQAENVDADSANASFIEAFKTTT